VKTKKLWQNEKIRPKNLRWGWIKKLLGSSPSDPTTFTPMADRV